MAANTMTWWNNYSIHAVTILSKVTKFHSGPLQQMRLELDQGEAGTIATTGFPIKMREAPAALQRPAPKLGEHTAEVLAELGFDATQCEDLRRRGVV